MLLSVGIELVPIGIALLVLMEPTEPAKEALVWMLDAHVSVGTLLVSNAELAASEGVEELS